jgi:glycogen debranching enzyme
MDMPLQPLLHDETVILRAPVQAWSSRDGRIGCRPIHGIYLSDVRILSKVAVTIGGVPGEHIATVPQGAGAVSFVSLLRSLDDSSADPRIRATHSRSVSSHGVRESVTIASTLEHPVATTIVVTLAADLAEMDVVKSGRSGQPATIRVDGETAQWEADAVSAALLAPGATLRFADGELTMTWPITIPAKGETSTSWTVTATDANAIVQAPTEGAPWSVPTIDAGDERLARWVAQALDDLDGLRLSTTTDAASQFFAAGAPWFFTLFGRDSIWAARFMLPLGTRMAADTLRVLAGLQGRSAVPATAEQPGKIMHELRRGTLRIPSEGVVLPPLYYGTVDATPLWVNLLYDAWRWGMADNEVRALLPNVVAALEWMRDFGDSDGDGLLEYVDETGHGLSNQGWKDSGDSVQWRDGTLAEGPIALCEVQAYAFEAATHGADMLEHFGFGDPQPWRDWAARLKERFDETFWIDDPAGSYPAIALDAAKNPVDTVTSNLGHLLGTGLLTGDQAALVAARLASPELDSGYGLRTMSTDSAGYWPLSYHGGSVWTHDTAIAIVGLVREGFTTEAGSLIEGLLAASSGFGYRMPELHSGDAASLFRAPVPYPAACRPQAWSAAAAIAVLGASLGLQPTQDGTALSVHPAASGSPISVRGLRFGGNDVEIAVDERGEISATSGAPIRGLTA